jgi:hypothetical protein
MAGGDGGNHSTNSEHSRGGDVALDSAHQREGAGDFDVAIDDSVGRALPDEQLQLGPTVLSLMPTPQPVHPSLP